MTSEPPEDIREAANSQREAKIISGLLEENKNEIIVSKTDVANDTKEKVDESDYLGWIQTEDDLVVGFSEEGYNQFAGGYSS